MTAGGAVERRRLEPVGLLVVDDRLCVTHRPRIVRWSRRREVHVGVEQGASVIGSVRKFELDRFAVILAKDDKSPLESPRLLSAWPRLRSEG